MKVQIIDLILFILFFQLISMVPFLFFYKSEKGISNIFLGIFLLAKAICITNFLSFRLYDFSMLHFPHLFYFGTSFTILWGPTLYLYIRSLTIQGFRLKLSGLIHFLPFLVHLIVLALSFHIYSAEGKREIMENGGLFSQQYWHAYQRLLQLYTVGYLIAAFIQVLNYSREIKNSYSSTARINLQWMNFILIGFMIKWSCDICFLFTDFGSTFSQVALFTSRAALFVFINLMVYKGLKQPYVFLGKQFEFPIRRQSLSEASKETYLQKLRNYMDKEKPYLEPEITLEQLSKMVAIPPRSLTTVLNECLNQNFYDFINSYRVRESARILLENTPRYKTVLEVLFESGFNNKSSFNSAFKKYNGMTPTEYRKVQASIPANLN